VAIPVVSLQAPVVAVTADVVGIYISRPPGSDARRWRDALGFAFAEATGVINREDFQWVERAIKDFHFVDQPNKRL
jgi:hypothetical protein